MTLPDPPPGWKPWHRYNQQIRTGYKGGACVAYVFLLSESRFLLRVYRRISGVTELYYLAHFKVIEEAFAAAQVMMEEEPCSDPRKARS